MKCALLLLLSLSAFCYSSPVSEDKKVSLEEDGSGESGKWIAKEESVLCEKDGKTYKIGETLEVGCESVCTCHHGRQGKMDCTERCSAPYFRSGMKISDPLCGAYPSGDPCCSIMACA